MFGNIGNFLAIAQKISFTLGSLIYLVFAIIVTKQTTMMSHNVKDKFNPVLIAISYFHLAFAVFLVFLTLAIL